MRALPNHFQRRHIGTMLSILLSQVFLFHSMLATIQGTFGFSSSLSSSFFMMMPHKATRTFLQSRPFSSSSSTMLAMSLTTNEETATKKKTRFGRFAKSKNESPKEQQQQRPQRRQKGIQITFVGKQHVATPPVPFTIENAPLLEQYFRIHKYRELLFPKNNATILEPIITQELFSTWCNEAELGGATGPTVRTILSSSSSHGMNDKSEKLLELYDTPNEKYQIMKITALLQMPSLQVKSESLIGVKLLLSPHGGDSTKSFFFPELQFTLLDSQLIPVGSKAAKWIFHQIMAYRDSTSSFTRVRVEQSNKDKGIVFTTDARLETKIHLPAAILKFLPSINVQKFEEQGSASIQKLLEKDLEPALVSFGNQFEVCMQDKAGLAASLELSP